MYTLKSDSDQWTVINALRVAAVQYATDASVHADNKSLNRAFLDQAAEANRIADEIEQAD